MTILAKQANRDDGEREDLLFGPLDTDSVGGIATTFRVVANVLSSPVPEPPASQRGGVGSDRWLKYANRVEAYGQVALEDTTPVRYPDEFSRRGPGLAPTLRAPKVLVSAKRSVQSPWRLKPVIDELGVVPRETMHMVVPRENSPENRRGLLAFLASRHASAWIDAYGPILTISPDLILSIPTREPEHESWTALRQLGAALIDNRSERRLVDTLRNIDEVVEDSLNLPESIRIRLSSLFAGRADAAGVVRYGNTDSRPPSGLPVERFGAVLDEAPGKLLIWVPGSTPEGGIWTEPPNRFLGWHCVPDATFDVVGPIGDLLESRFAYQRVAYLGRREEGLNSPEPWPVRSPS
jgi:hypothetical protein